jgi:hypothetical protein
MKGISTIFATMLIVVIVVALISITYVSASSIFSSTMNPTFMIAQLIFYFAVSVCIVELLLKETKKKQI